MQKKDRTKVRVMRTSIDTVPEVSIKSGKEERKKKGG